MRKGVATRYLVFLFLGIVIFAFGIYLAIFYAPGLVDAATRIFYALGIPGENGEGNGEWASGEEMVEAIKCSYYRCTEGCDYVNAMTWQHLTDANCPCSEWYDETAKVCDDQAKGHPVKVQVIEETAVYMNEIEFTDCLMSQVDYTNVLGGDRIVVIVDKDDVEQEIGKGICRGLHMIGDNYESLVIKPGTYYVWSWSYPWGILGTKDTSVTTESPAACTDTDGGDNKLVKGTCTDPTGSYTDTCLPANNIGEYMCNPTGDSCVGSADTSCPAGTICVDGACSPTVTLP